jgi:hypothetical protein
MTKRSLSLEMAAVTLIALAITFWWALDPILISIFMMTRSGTDVELIRQIWHFRLVQPEWVDTSDQLWRWQQAETFARLAVVFVGWVSSIAALIRRYRRGKPRHLTKRWSERRTAVCSHLR